QREDLEKLDTTFTAGTPSTVTIGKDGSIRTVHWWRWEQLRETLRLSSIWASFVERCKECLLPDLSMRPKNPIGLLIGINKRQCLAFMAMWLVWILDAIDFCTIPIIMSEIAEYFDTEPSNVTMAIIATLGTRPVGAAISGPIADRFGRRIPLLAIVVLYIGFEVASGFSNSLGMYFGLRAAF
ncbi:Carboxylic acid transporter, partial [Spiromyces aspiralis]